MPAIFSGGAKKRIAISDRFGSNTIQEPLHEFCPRRYVGAAKFSALSLSKGHEWRSSDDHEAFNNRSNGAI